LRNVSTKCCSENLKGRAHSEDFGVGGEIILGRILENQGRKLWTGFIRLRIGTSGGSCEHGNEPLGFINGGEFLD
jgi:hypothetical protein